MSQCLIKIYIYTRNCGIVMFSVACVFFVCLSALVNAFTESFMFAAQIHLKNIYVKVEYEGHGIKVKVIRA